MIEYLEIQNYKMFEKIRLEGLGRVNLIVGKNNVGKSSVLEAAFLATCPRFHRGIYRVLKFRNLPIKSRLMWSIEGLFGDSSQDCCFRHSDPAAFRRMRIRYPEKNIFVTNPVFCGSDEATKSGWELPFQPSLLQFLAGESRPEDEMHEPTFIDSMRFIDNDRDGTWDILEAFSRTELIQKALQLIEPKIEKVALIRDDGLIREPYVRISGRSELVKLSTLGTGSRHLFDIAFALVKSEKNSCFVDEIENGLHYELHDQVCDFIFNLAANLGVQVFLTTHSLDFTRAFARAANRSAEKGMLYRLTNQLGFLEVVSYSEKEMLIAAEQEIEVR